MDSHEQLEGWYEAMQRWSDNANAQAESVEECLMLAGLTLPWAPAPPQAALAKVPWHERASIVRTLVKADHFRKFVHDEYKRKSARRQNGNSRIPSFAPTPESTRFFQALRLSMDPMTEEGTP